MCLPGDGPRLGLGPAGSVPRAQVPDGESPGSTLLGAAPPRFWAAGPSGRGETKLRHTVQTDVICAWERVLQGPLSECQQWLSLGGVFPGDFNFNFYVYRYLLSLLEDDHVSSVSLKVFYFKILPKRSPTSPGPHVP